MQLTVEISSYPLAEDYLTPIQDFIDQLNQYPAIMVLTNTLSTQLFGEYDEVMQALQACIKLSYQKYGKVIFVCKFLHGDLRP